ncbi:hypothetical protein [Pseudomonas thivervalensis]|uniref:hypothetical protein n=1 Tax=Pseudomonas thivervalensis TaxID=86265 RepID=UPI003D6AABC2
MNVSMLAEWEANRAIKKLIKNCNQYAVAVAWAGANEIVDAMLDAEIKLGMLVIGTHMYQTDPAVLRRFSKCKGVRCLPPNGRLFHPKLYYFKMPDGYAAVVGSHNLTGGAFGGKNIELSVLLQGDKKDILFRDLEGFIKSSWSAAEDILEDSFLFAYEAQYFANKAKLKDLNKFYRLKRPIGAKTSPLALTWENFVNGVNNDGYHNLEGRLTILERAASLFSEHGSFDAMSRLERKAIAGTYGANEPAFDNIDWAWFGRMSGQGDFKNLVNEFPQLLSKALDNIPADGDISEEDFNAFSQDFDRAFRKKTHKGGIATASRLLVMKRPDFFIGVNDANKRGVCGAFGAAHSTLTLGNYWERIIIPMQNSPWWLSPRPRAKLAGRIWDNRSALLDSIYYEPK